MDEDDDFDMDMECPECGAIREYQEWYPRGDGDKCPECGEVTASGDF